MKIKLSILLFLLMVLKTYASTAFFPKTINVWNSKEQAKIIGNCENQDKGSSDNSLPKRIRCQFTQISIKHEPPIKSKMNAKETLEFYLNSRKVKSIEELKRILCAEFNKSPELEDLSDPFGKKRYQSFVHLCQKDGNISEFIKSEVDNWSENIVNIKECSLSTQIYSLDFKHSSTNNDWISTTEPQRNFCGMIVVTRLHLDPESPFWHYSDTHIVTNPEDSFGTLPSADNSCSKLPKSTTTTFYGVQKFIKEKGFNANDISSSRNTIFVKC
ncbi:TPA: hypothetical protein GDC94_16510, partial [Legionella pneumophila]|nr:hypothetical protein [Legionella pneumophila]